jgi:hypothetical protein
MPCGTSWEQGTGYWFRNEHEVLLVQKRICIDLQNQLWEDVPFIPMGEYWQATAYRKGFDRCSARLFRDVLWRASHLNKCRSTPTAYAPISNLGLFQCGRFRRVSPVAPRPRDGPMTEPTAGAQPWPRERVLMPRSGHTWRVEKMAAAMGKRAFRPTSPEPPRSASHDSRDLCARLILPWILIMAPSHFFVLFGTALLDSDTQL